MKLKLPGIAILLSLCTVAHSAELSFSHTLSDNAVLQRDKPVLIRGAAGKGSDVTVTFAGQTKKAMPGEDGQWEVTLDPMPANAAPQQLTARSSLAAHPVTLDNVVVGDVVLFARQTSVDISLGRDAAGQGTAAKLSRDPGLRVMMIRTIPAATPQSDLDPRATAGWVELDRKSALAMSGAAFYLGRELAGEVDVPVGIVDLNMGPNFTIGWMDREAIANNDDYYGRKTRISGYAKLMDGSLEKYRSQAGKPRPENANSKNWVEEAPLVHPLFPAAGYNAVLHPLRGMALKAAVVQLGNDYPYLAYEKLRRDGGLFDREQLKSAWWTTYLYRKRAYRAAFEVLPRLPALWRKYFDDRQLPLAFVMPPSSANNTYAIHHHEIREVQRQTAAANAGVGLIVAGNDHIPFSGQPADDAGVGRRGLAWLLGSVYGREGTAPCGPLFERMEINFNKAQIFFREGTAAGLKASGNALDMFEAAATDREWFPATATIDGNTTRVECDGVNQITYLRYNYKQRPDYGLTNGQGLPAVPFRTGEHEWIDKPRNMETQLPEEYTTPASEWKSDGIAIISGGGAAYADGPGFLGATGLKVSPFGPNMRVTSVMSGSPAEGKINVGDLIYGVNGQPVGDNESIEDDQLHTVARAIAFAESDAGAGKIVFSLRRDTKLLDVELKLEVLGTISSTTPYDCPKSERIISNCEKFLAERGGLSVDYAGGGWVHTDILLLMGAGNPKYQGLVRRFIYDKMRGIDSGSVGSSCWMLAYGLLLFDEYYHATGDRSVLPYIKEYCDALAVMQCREDTFEGLDERSVGGWRHGYPGGKDYGMMPTIGLPAMIGLTLAREAGVEVDAATYARGMRFVRDGQAEMGVNNYSSRAREIPAPDPMDPTKMANGRMGTGNGARGLAAILFSLTGDTRITHLNSMYCAYGWNSCNEGHASTFFNGVFTPVGASLHSRAAFINFMRNHYWYQDLRRMYDHSYRAAGRSSGLGPNLALVIPRQRLRILGAPRSVFGANPSEALKPSLDAYAARDYQRAARLADALVAGGELDSGDRAKATQLARAARELQESIAMDLANSEALIKEGKFYQASLDLAQLKGVMPDGDTRLAAIEKAVTGRGVRARFDADKNEYTARIKTLRKKYPDQVSPVSSGGEWQSLTTVDKADRRHMVPGVVEDGQGTVWRARVVEAVSQAPEGWLERGFDDSDWRTGTLPFSWHLNHSLVARTTFEVTDKKAIRALRVSVSPYRQQNIVVYINGKMVAKFNQCEAAGGWVHGDLSATALKALRHGPNTIAFHTTNDWRWAVRETPHQGGFSLNLAAKVTSPQEN